MPNPVSIVVWRDAKTDPPTGEQAFADVLALHHDGDVTLEDPALVVERPGFFKAWAELPVVSDLTDDDVRVAVQALNDIVHLDTQSYPDWAVNAARLDRLRAALGGEKEEGDA